MEEIRRDALDAGFFMDSVAQMVGTMINHQLMIMANMVEDIVRTINTNKENYYML